MKINELATEQRNPNTMDIDRVSTLEMVTKINNEDKKVAGAVEAVLPEIAKAIDAITDRFKQGGRFVYCGAGNSGRIAGMDAIELTPTFGLPPERALVLIAGATQALTEAVEGAEDSQDFALKDLGEINLNKNDIIIAIAASGRTPYCITILEEAKKIGALTVSITCSPNSVMENLADHAIVIAVGPEVITGSTRLKAGTAQKMVANMISSSVMIKMGKVYENLMVNVQPKNEKLRIRAKNIVVDALGYEDEKITEVLKDNAYDVSLTIVMLKKNIDAESAKKLLLASENMVAKAIQD